jgi:tetratricopeptide (TPR) repeat protein
MAAIPASGSLRDTPLPKLLLELYRGRFNGSLRLTRERLEKTFLFQEGVPIFAESNLASETLGVQLMDAGRISRADHVEVSSYVQEKKCKEGVALLDMGLLDPKSLFAALKEQVRMRIVDCFAWPRGEFDVEPAAAPPTDAQPFRADIYPLVQEGIETHWGAERILTDLSDRMDARVARTRRLSRIQERLLWDDGVQEFIDALDGRHTLWMAIQSANTPRALAAAWVLDAVSAIDYREGAIPGAEEQETEIELVVTRTPAPSRGRTALEADGPETVPDDGAGAVLLQEIDDKCAHMGELDHYALLGVEPDAAPAQIRAAYLVAAKRYHPDALARAGIPAEIRGRAGKVFAAIGKAHAVLSNPAQRRDYDARLDLDEADLDAERLAAAETNFRKAEILMRQGNFRGALEYLEPAAELWPDEPAYQGALGWALYKKTPADLERARLHLERAVELAPRDAVLNQNLSVVLKALGEKETAAAVEGKGRGFESDAG